MSRFYSNNKNMQDFIFEVITSIGYEYNYSAPDKLFKYLSNNDVVNMKNDFLWLEDIKFGDIRYMILEIYSEYYTMEKYEYIVMGEDLFSEPESDTLDEYIAKYPSAKRTAIKKYARNNKSLNDNDSISFYMSHIRQEKADDLIFEILKRHSAEWWD